MFEPGQQIDRYEVIRPLGEGGMAKVFLIRDPVLDCYFALKVLDPALRTNDQIRSRFLVEARIQAQGKHPNIIRVFCTISTEQLAGIVMEYVDGPSLEEFIRHRQQRPTVGEIVELFLPLLYAVRYAHSQKVVHRDIKPSNIILQKRDHGFDPKIGDFGVAKVNEIFKLSAGKKSTKGDHPIGTYGYMSPEQIRTPGVIDHRSDLFSLGSTLYELATLKSAFTGSDYDVQEAVVHGRYVPPNKFNIDKRIVRIIQKSLRSSPEERYQSCDELIADMESIHASILAQRRHSLRLGWGLLALGAPLLGIGFLGGYAAHDRLAGVSPIPPPPAPIAADPTVHRSQPAMAVRLPVALARSSPPNVVAVPLPIDLGAPPADLATSSAPTRLAESRYRPALVPIVAGSFAMGSAAPDERPRRQVTLSHAFYIAETELTRAQYKSMMGTALVNDSDWASRVSMSPAEKRTLPMGDLTWFDAVRFCNRLSKIEKLETCYQLTGQKVVWTKQYDCLGYRLPTEAEWEYAATAGQNSTYPGSASLDKVAWAGSNSGQHPHPVKQKQPNAWGLFDLAGNIAEWVWDDYSAYQGNATFDPINDERPAGAKPCRVLRGANWNETIEPRFRIKNRVCFDPDMPASIHGLRVARTITASR